MGEFFEPREMAILPNLDILVAQRRGEIMMYNHLTKTVKQAGFLNVYFKTLHTPKVNAEEGVLGIQADPNFAANHFVYIYYSPTDTSVNRLSRFTFVNNHIDNKSEKIILQLYSQPETCCHTGGSIAFDGDSLLLVPPGVLCPPLPAPTPPSHSRVCAPMDAGPAPLRSNPRRGEVNTNAPREKTLRTKGRAEGTTDTPGGTPSPPGEKKPRPE